MGNKNYAIIIQARLHHDGKTKRVITEVAEVAGVTEVTIRNRYKELIQNLNIELEI